MTRPGEAPLEFTEDGTEMVEATRLQALDTVLEREHATHLRMERHMWIVLVAYRGTDKLLDAWDEASNDPYSPPRLDSDTLMAAPGMACYVCGTAYEPRLRRRKCPGEMV